MSMMSEATRAGQKLDKASNKANKNIDKKSKDSKTVKKGIRNLSI